MGASEGRAPVERTRYEHGTPSWVDLGVSDLDGEAAFYSALFGWDVERGGADVGHYSMATLAGAPVAALSGQAEAGAPVAWATYVTVVDVGSAVERVQAGGGQVVVEPMDVMALGRMAMVTDPGGAVLSLWQAGGHVGAGRTGEPGTLCWVELTTRHVSEAVAFYGSVFGWTAAPLEDGGTDYHEWRRPDGTAVAGMLPMVGDEWPPGLPDHWMVYFGVVDVDAAVGRCAQLGGTIAVPPTDVPLGRFAVLADPEGATFSVIAL
jgi:uncharacterized protein